MTSSTLSDQSQKLFQFFQRLASVSAVPAMLHFRNKVAVENKTASNFDPVTVADRETETAIRQLIETEYPDHGILGEEYGATKPDAAYQWVIDPIDGTRAYISGLPLWGTLVGLTFEGKAIAGMMAQPFTREVYVGVPGGAYVLHDGAPEVPIAASHTRTLADATLMTTTPSLYAGAKSERYAALEETVRLPRYGCDCYAFAMLAAGHVDLVVEPGLQPYDIAGLIAPIQEAGGIVTTWDGGRPEGGGDVIAAATPELHKAASDILMGRV
ncbi:MAG: histidinol-phosphatase [Pseudomonadota bacterium]